MNQLFEHIPKHPLKSLSIDISYQSDDEVHRIMEICSSRIIPYGLEEMHLDISSEHLAIINVFQSLKHVLRCLKIDHCTYEQYHRILSSFVNLKTLSIMNYCWKEDTSTVLPLFTQLRSLTINPSSALFKPLCSVLSLTPFLVYLKITIQYLDNDCHSNGAGWEEFLRRKLIHLKNFQFCFVYKTNEVNQYSSLNRLIQPFKTSFWVNEKRWFVICEFVLKSYNIILYTSSLAINDNEPAIRYTSTLSSNDDYQLMNRPGTSRSNHLSSEQVTLKSSIIII